MKDTLIRKKKLLKELIDQETDTSVLAQVFMLLRNENESLPPEIDELLEMSLNSSDDLVEHTSARDLLNKR